MRIQSNRLRNKYRFTAYLPNETEFRLVVIKMDGLLPKSLFNSYLAEMKVYRKNVKIRDQREQRKMKKLIEKAKERRRMERFKEYEDMIDFGSFPKFAEQETDESFKLNKNDPSKYPELKKIEVKEEVEIKNPILKMELERMKRLKLEKEKKKSEMGETYEEEKENEEESGVILIKKKSKKKKRGKKRKRRGKKNVGIIEKEEEVEDNK